MNDDCHYYPRHGVNAGAAYALECPKDDPATVRKSSIISGRQKPYSSFMPVASPQAIEKIKNIKSASRIINLAPNMSLNFA
jgi:hypothetical protein